MAGSDDRAVAAFNPGVQILRGVGCPGGPSQVGKDPQLLGGARSSLRKRGWGTQGHVTSVHLEGAGTARMTSEGRRENSTLLTGTTPLPVLGAHNSQ